MKHKKRLIILALFILLFGSLVFIGFRRKPLAFITYPFVNELFLNKNNLASREGYYISEKEDVLEILRILRSMKTYKRKDIELKEVNYTIYINLINGATISIGILPDEMIIIGNKFYKTDTDYSISFDELIIDISRKYNNIIIN